MDSRTPLDIVLETWREERRQWKEERSKMAATIRQLREEIERRKEGNHGHS